MESAIRSFDIDENYNRFSRVSIQYTTSQL
jgi:hypothetical protein